MKFVLELWPDVEPDPQALLKFAVASVADNPELAWTIVDDDGTVIADAVKLSSANREAVLGTVLTADEAYAWITQTTVRAEVDFTEANNEDRTLADYVADVRNVLDRILEGDGYDELVPAPLARKAS